MSITKSCTSFSSSNSWHAVNQVTPTLLIKKKFTPEIDTFYKYAEFNGELFSNCLTTEYTLPGGRKIKGLGHEALWLLGDFAATVRAIITISSSILKLGSIAIGSVVIAGSLGFTGLISTVTAGVWMIPQALKTLERADSRLASIKKIQEIELSNIAHIKEAENNVSIERWNVWNQCTFFALGLEELALGIITGLTTSISSVLDYAPILENALLGLSIIGDALGVTSILRGVGMIVRAYKCKKILYEFHDEFRRALKIDSDAACNFITTKRKELLALGLAAMTPEEQTQLKEDPNNEALLQKQYDLGLDYFNRRVGSELAERIMAGEEINVDFLQEMDKAIYLEQCKQNVLFAVGVVSLLGGLGAFVAGVLSLGKATVVIALALATFTVLSEIFVLAPYDWLDATKWIGRKLYQSSNQLKSLQMSLNPPPPNPTLLQQTPHLLQQQQVVVQA